MTKSLLGRPSKHTKPLATNGAGSGSRDNIPHRPNLDLPEDSPVRSPFPCRRIGPRRESSLSEIAEINGKLKFLLLNSCLVQAFVLDCYYVEETLSSGKQKPHLQRSSPHPISAAQIPSKS